METFNDEAWIEKPCLNDQNGEEYSNQNRETDVQLLLLYVHNYYKQMGYLLMGLGIARYIVAYFY